MLIPLGRIDTINLDIVWRYQSKYYVHRSGVSEFSDAYSDLVKSNSIRSNVLVLDSDPPQQVPLSLGCYIRILSWFRVA